MDKRFIIGIDLGGTNLKVAILDHALRIRLKHTETTRKFHNKEELIRGIFDCIDQLMQRARLQRSDILGVGLGLPGPIDFLRGIVHFFPNIPGWKKVQLKKILEKKLKLPVFLDNDANLMALAEYTQGAARGSRNAVCITLGTGVGGGLILGGALYRGSTFCAGEIGHIPINEKGSRCNCRGSACIETYVGNARIQRRIRAVFEKDLSLEEVSALARKGNSMAKAIWREAGRHLGVMLVGVINLLNPDVVVIGGGIAGAGKALFENIREIVLARAMAIQARHVRIVSATLGNDAGVIGAAILVKENLR